MLPSHKFISFLTAVLALIVQSCASSVYDDSPSSVVEPDEEGMVVLGLNVIVGGASDDVNVATRAFAGSEDNTFEAPQSEYELLKTLRVIIVRPDGSVEHNRYVELDAATGTIINDKLEFKVKSDEIKKIYLFGNEAAVDYDFKPGNITEGLSFPTKDVENITLKASGSVINNDQTSLTRTYIPMSECFDLRVDYPQTPEDRYIRRTLFLTRSLIKFSFSVRNEVPYKIGARLTGISITGLAGSSFYLPRNTVYLPSKYDPSSYNLSGRYITSFVMPANSGTTKCDFPVLPYFDVDSDVKELTFSPYIYLPETKTSGSYQLSLHFDDHAGEVETLSDWLGSKPLELKDIPRNTHVKVNITLKGSVYDVEVQMVPYTGVGLTPDFGLDVDKNLVPIYNSNGELMYYYNKMNGKYYDKNNRNEEIPNPYLGVDPNTGLTIIRDDNGDILYYYDETTGQYYDKDLKPIDNPYV